MHLQKQPMQTAARALGLRFLKIVSQTMMLLHKKATIPFCSQQGRWQCSYLQANKTFAGQVEVVAACMAAPILPHAKVYLQDTASPH
jgi:hypothetical protein